MIYRKILHQVIYIKMKKQIMNSFVPKMINMFELIMNIFITLKWIRIVSKMPFKIACALGYICVAN